MDWNTISGQWNQLKGSVKKQWGRLTDDEIDEVNGERDRLVGKLQERYGYSRQEAETEVERFSNMR